MQKNESESVSMRIQALFIAFFLLLSNLPAPAARAEVDLSLFELSGEIAAYSIESQTCLYDCGETAALNSLADGEFYTYVLHLRYTGDTPIQMKNMSVSVDGGAKWGWGEHTLQPGSVCIYPIYYVNMKNRMTEGAHTVTWYLGQQVLMQKTLTFVADMDWQTAFSLPTEAQIAAHNSTTAARSPYLYGWLKISDQLHFTEYAIDFKADTLPEATYLCLANMKMDLSALEKQYASVRTEYSSVTMYAGFQRRYEDTIGILSFWDIFCTDKSGHETTLRAQLMYPTTYNSSASFTGEGEGAHALIPYAWEADHWYRMLLQCSQSADTGTTLVDQWVLDLETGVWTLLSRYDTLIPSSCFTGPVAFFLENYDPKYSGQVRTMEVCNIRLRRADNGKWQAVSSVTIGARGGLPQYEGSYAFGAQGNRFYMITSGVGGDWYSQGRVRQNQVLKVTDSAQNSPY